MHYVPVLTVSEVWNDWEDQADRLKDAHIQTGSNFQPDSLLLPHLSFLSLLYLDLTHKLTKFRPRRFLPWFFSYLI